MDHDGQAQGQDCCSFSVVAALKSKSVGSVVLVFIL